ncbi:alpha-endosulfine-like [Argopecten irradians]|uniref:alpha-endosulfine-like n=1 Tax=Argopecten irradians TaxID=31199 RepID=UPI00371B4793
MSSEELSTEQMPVDQTETGSDSQEEQRESPTPKGEFVQPAPPKKMSTREEMLQEEKKEEKKLKSKYPNFNSKAGGSALLAKRMQQRKYFDSGDYMMAQAKVNNPKIPLAPKEKKMILQESIGDAIPTPENLPPRKASIATSKLASGQLAGPLI